MWLSEKVYFKAENYFGDLLEGIRAARKTIELESYIFTDDEIGVSVMNELKRAADRGVQVRVLIDAIGSIFWEQSVFEIFRNSRVQIRLYNVWRWPWLRIIPLNKRLHRKICIVDNQSLFLGSFNIGKKDSRETGARVTATQFDELRKSFDRLWERRFNFRGQSFLPEYLKLRFNENRKIRRLLIKDLIHRLRTAEKRIWIANAYFVPPLYIQRALKKAAEQGADVRILLPAISDLPFFKSLSVRYYQALIESGIKIFEYKKEFMHAKTILIDNWVMVGSSNLNHRSFVHDLEIDIVLESENSLKELEAQYLIDQKDSNSVTMESVRRRKWLDVLIGWTLYRLRYWL